MKTGPWKSKEMFYTVCKPEDLGTDSAKLLHATEEACSFGGYG